MLVLGVVALLADFNIHAAMCCSKCSEVLALRKTRLSNAKATFCTSMYTQSGGLVTCCYHKWFALPLAKQLFGNVPVPHG